MTRVRLALIFIKPLSIPKGFMPYSVKRLFKINKDVIEVFIMLSYLSHNILRLKIKSVALRPSLKPVCCSPIIVFWLGLQPV